MELEQVLAKINEFDNIKHGNSDLHSELIFVMGDDPHVK